jgi:uncharacterized protein (TIGR04255 family)
MDARENTIWRFHDASGAWRVTLAPDFLALETSLYTSRDEFLDRLRRVLEALVAHVDPKVIDRLGVRYIDRVTGDNLSDLPQLVRPEVCGVLSTALASHAHHSISESVFVLPDNAGQVMARWGLAPARGTVDPAAVDAIDEPSWLLDVDAFQAEARELHVEAVVQQAREFAERIYSVFRWVVPTSSFGATEVNHDFAVPCFRDGARGRHRVRDLDQPSRHSRRRAAAPNNRCQWCARGVRYLVRGAGSRVGGGLPLRVRRDDQRAWLGTLCRDHE